MEYRTIVKNYFMYMWNHWDYFKAIEIFGETLGQHIWEKWVNICEDYGSIGGVAILWSQLDIECQEKLAEAANNYYNN